MTSTLPATTVNMIPVWGNSLPEVLRAAADKIEELATEQAEDGLPPCYQTFYVSGPNEHYGKGNCSPSVKPDHWGLSYSILVCFD